MHRSERTSGLARMMVQGRRISRSRATGLVACAAVLAVAAAGTRPVLARPRHGPKPVPGALPHDYRFVYNDTYRGWPLWPRHEQHPLRGSFLEPRSAGERGLFGYHFGIDISVDDYRPERGAGSMFSHRVYAVESGTAIVRKGARRMNCGDRRLSVGHFAYWHVSPTVRPGTWVHAGAPIGWTCRGMWHLHLSEWTLLGGARIWVNPLHVGGKLVPYVDRAPPVVHALRFFTPPVLPWHPLYTLREGDTATRLDPSQLSGRVEIRAEIDDRQSFWGWLARHPTWHTPQHPYRVAVAIRFERTGAVVLHRIAFQSDTIPETPYLVHYAPGTVKNSAMWECIAAPPGAHCGGQFWFRPLSQYRLEYWNTLRVRNGRYRVTVRAWDVKRNTAALTAIVTVANG
jgi:hypothetical protein